MTFLFSSLRVLRHDLIMVFQKHNEEERVISYKPWEKVPGKLLAAQLSILGRSQGGEVRFEP